jgi:hypothetical protein
MKTKYLILPISLGLIFSLGCNHHTGKQKTKLALTRLRKKDIYNKKLVDVLIYTVKQKKEDSVIAKGTKLCDAGLALYKDKKDTAALTVLKQSITIFPKPEAYFGLGQVLLDMQNTAATKEKGDELTEAVQAFEMAEYLKYQPVPDVYYNLACAENLLVQYDSAIHKSSADDFNQAIYNLTCAFKKGFNDTLALQSDGRISSLMATDEYAQMITELRTKNSFESFKLEFTPLSLPYTIGYDNVGVTGTQINDDYVQFIPGMQDAHFDRGVSYDYYAVGELNETPNYVALVYTCTQFYDGPDADGFQPVYTVLITYSPGGTQIDSMTISQQTSEDYCTGVKIDTNLITLQNYKLLYKYSQNVLDSLNNEKIYLQNETDEIGNKVLDVTVNESSKTELRPRLDSMNAILDTIDAHLKSNVLLKAEPDTKAYCKLLANGKIERINNDGKVTIR